MMVALYARVSTDKQDETLQIPRLRAYCERCGHDIYKVYQDEASARNADRPGWKALMSDAHGHRFDAIVVTKIDRVMRSLVGLHQTMEDLGKCGITLITLDQGPMDFTSPNGRLLISFLGSVAEWEREMIAARTREALAAKKADGVKLGRPRKDAPLRKIALMRYSGKTLREISRETGVSLTWLSNHKLDIIEEMAIAIEDLGNPVWARSLAGRGGCSKKGGGH
jgi:DNA invertase Pin-like site-specific DNA recombinase